jgi:hypothetical protein
MKIQIRDADSWRLLAETSLAGKHFTVIGDLLFCDDVLKMQVIADGTPMPIAFLVTDQGKFLRVIDLDLSTPYVRDGHSIEIPVGAFSWGATQPR